ncbi:MAG TPA: tripartite tricarboxylate transporter substrate binding protein [Hyphomicrobiaceae bacterium]|nr:tripartite tricarboxylate transporter substrate binding protein [Hyphomicrobiaceae bacterium]
MQLGRILPTAFAVLMACAGAAAAQENWPTKPVRFIVNFAPGGGTDNATRPFADRLSKIFGQQFVVENKPGASGTIGVESVVRSAPDGYTFLATGSPVLTVVPQARKVNWDPFKDLVPVGRFADYMLPIAVHPSVPVNTIKELEAYAKANPGKLNCGSAGLGTFTHLICETLKTNGGIDNVHVPYRGGADALNDFLAGVTQIHSEPNGMPHIKSGKVKLLAIADRERHPDFPHIPLIAEVYPEIKIVGWYALFAPAGTPPAIIKRLNEEINKIAMLPELKPQFLGLALRPVTGSAEQFAAMVKADYDYYGEMVRALNLKLE